jgi:hypothetical protein
MEKPKVVLTGADGNVFNLLSICTKALKEAGQRDKAKELGEKLWEASSYEHALCLMAEFCEVE